MNWISGKQHFSEKAILSSIISNLSGDDTSKNCFLAKASGCTCGSLYTPTNLFL